MAIANGRNNMLASIEDSASMLNSLVDELDRFYLLTTMFAIHIYYFYC